MDTHNAATVSCPACAGEGYLDASGPGSYASDCTRGGFRALTCEECGGSGELLSCVHCHEPQRDEVCSVCAHWIKRVGVEGLRKLLIECAVVKDEDGRDFVERMAKEVA